MFSSHDQHNGSVRSEVRSCTGELTGCLPVSSQITAIFSSSGVYNFLPHVAVFYLYTPCNFPIPPPSLFLSEAVSFWVYLCPHFCLLHSPFQLSPCLGIGVNEKGGLFIFNDSTCLEMNKTRQPSSHPDLLIWYLVNQGGAFHPHALLMFSTHVHGR